MTPGKTSLIIAFLASVMLMASAAIASETRQLSPGASGSAAGDAKVSYRYSYPVGGCYYVKKCVRANRWGKCYKFRWKKVCGPRRVL